MSNTAFALPDRTLVLDRYRPLKPLGRGGSGSVWLSHDERTGLEVALKIVPREGKRAARASREMEAASRLRHERCVRAYDFGGDAGHVYIAYEYVRGRTLRETLRTDGLADAEAVEIAAQVLDGLAHAHRRGIVHRDVKPSNVLVEESEELSIRVLDFGLAQFDEADTLTAVGDVPGTLAYISPERLSGEEATERSDIWAVGVILWEALAGSHPFWGVPLPQVASTITSGAPPLSARRPDLPRRLLAAVDAALAVDASKRPSATRLAAELREAYVARPSQRREPRRSTTRRSRPAPRVRRTAPAVPLASRVADGRFEASTASAASTAARSRRGRSGRRAESGGAPEAIVDATCGSGTPQKGWLPASASQRITPTAQMSLRSVASSPESRSGEMYASVPGTSPTPSRSRSPPRCSTASPTPTGAGSCTGT